MDTHDDFPDLMRRIRAGDEDAAEELYHKYGHYVLKVVRRHLHQRLRPRFDSEDFAQSVWTAFFARQASSRDFEDPAALIAFLKEVARNKVAGAHRKREETAKHNPGREYSLNDHARQDSTGAIEVFVAGKDPTPSQVVMADEQWDRLMEGQPQHHRVILSLLRQGYTHEEIAERIGTSTKTIQRLLRVIHPELVP